MSLSSDEDNLVSKNVQTRKYICTYKILSIDLSWALIEPITHSHINDDIINLKWELCS